MNTSLRTKMLDSFLLRHPLLSKSTRLVLMNMILVKDKQGYFLLRNEDDMEDLVNYVESNF